LPSESSGVPIFLQRLLLRAGLRLGFGQGSRAELLGLFLGGSGNLLRGSGRGGRHARFRFLGRKRLHRLAGLLVDHDVPPCAPESRSHEQQREEHGERVAQHREIRELLAFMLQAQNRPGAHQRDQGGHRHV